MTRKHGNPNGVPRPRRAQRRRCRRAPSLLALVLLFLLPLTAWPQAVPESTQIPIFFKMLTYDRTLWEGAGTRLRIGVLHRAGDADSDNNMTAIVQALSGAAEKTVNNVRIEFVTISWSGSDDLSRKIAEARVAVLYVTSGHRQVLDEVTNASRGLGILTITGSPGYVDAGVAVGLDLDRDRPRLEVNLAALEAEGHQLDARVLRLSRVVDR